jgi:protein-L-isoaspartate(D-aspartate) O-methyltransferase
VTTLRQSGLENPVQAVSLRAAMVRELRRQHAIRSEPVAAAFAAVPRHVFARGEQLDKAYAPEGVIEAKRGPDGLVLSVMSAAHLQAVMLEQAAIEPGMRVLEVGSGGYNAALIQELVGQSGQVTTVDIDADITHRAEACLHAAGYDGVNVVLADAEGGVPENAPYDRILVTASAWDIPPAWISQLTEQGMLIVPLRLRGLTRSIAFGRDGDGLVSRDYCLARFVPMQGGGAYDERKVMLRDGIALQTDDPGVRLDAQTLNEALSSPGLESWSGAAWDLPDELELYLTVSLPDVARLHASQAVIDQGIIAQSALMGVTAVVSGGSFAYRVKRANESTGGYESGVVAHGPQSRSLAEQYTDALRQWARDFRRRGVALFRYQPTDAAPAHLPHRAIAKRHGIVTISWRQAAGPADTRGAPGEPGFAPST